MQNNKVKELVSYVLIIIVVILIKKFVFTPVRVNGVSMKPTLNNKDIMILNEVGYYLNGIERFDIIVVKYKNEKLIKRVIGFPGETVSYKDGNLYINDKKLDENFSHYHTDDYALEDVIPMNCYFVVGDNRNDSIDSRIIGVINKKQILGKTNLLIFPFKRMGKVN